MEKKLFEGYKYIDGGVCAASEFTANGLNCGYNSDKNKNDLCLINCYVILFIISSNVATLDDFIIPIYIRNC